MRVILKKAGYSFDNIVFGKKVIATRSTTGKGIEVKGSELQRLGVSCNVLFINFSYHYCEDNYEEVKPQFINCTDNSTCRENWQEYYERKV